MSSISEPTKCYIHYNPVRTDYSISDSELIRLQEATNNISKDIFLLLFPIGFSCLLNAIQLTTTPFVLTISIFLNYLLGFIGIIAGGIAGLFWYKTRGKLSSIILEIKAKPKIELNIANNPPTTQS